MRAQEAGRFEGLHLPEPWNGHIEQAAILFVGSNPALGMHEEFPHAAWTDFAVAAFFDERFDGHWISEGIYTRRLDGEYQAAQAFCSGIRARARELLPGRNVVPGVDYALTEIVHCKSNGEVGVAGARRTCADLYLLAVLERSGARVIIALGTNAEEELRALLGAHAPGRVAAVRGGRLLVCIPHPNARTVRMLAKVLTQGDLERVRAHLRAM